MERVHSEMPVYPPRCHQSNLLSALINVESTDGTDKMLFHHQGYHLICDNVYRERLYPTVKTQASSRGRSNDHQCGRIVNLSNQCDFTQ